MAQGGPIVGKKKEKKKKQTKKGTKGGKKKKKASRMYLQHTWGKTLTRMGVI